MKEKRARYIDCCNLSEIHGTKNAMLEKVVVASPGFRDGELRLLYGVSPLEVTQGTCSDLPPRTEEEWDQPLFPYLLCRGDRVLALLTVEEAADGEEPEDEKERDAVDDRRAQPPAGLLRVDFRQGQEQGAGSLTGRLGKLPPEKDGGFRCDLSPLPCRLVPDLTRLGLLREGDPKAYGGDTPLPTTFGAECGLVKAYWAEKGSLHCGTLCGSRTVAYLENLIAAWPVKVASQDEAPPFIPLTQRLIRVQKGFASTPAYGKRLVERLGSSNIYRYLTEGDMTPEGIRQRVDTEFFSDDEDTFLTAAEKLHQTIQAFVDRGASHPHGNRLRALSAPLIPPKWR